MVGWRPILVVVVVCLLVLGGWCPELAAHRRSTGPLPRIISKAPPPAPAAPDRVLAPLTLTPASYWQRLEALSAGDRWEPWQETALAFINIFPKDPQVGAALVKLAQGAALRGETAKALELLGLAARLGQGTAMASQAGLQAATLELSLELPALEPGVAFRRFLEKTMALAPPPPPEALTATWSEGWRLLAQELQGKNPCPLPLLEELLALWDLQPPELRPAEGALLLAELLKQGGFLVEAQAFLEKAGQTPGPGKPLGFSRRTLELLWLSRGWFGVEDFLRRYPGTEGEIGAFLCSRLMVPGETPQVPSTPAIMGENHKEALWAWFLPKEAHAGNPERRLAVLEQALQYSWPALMAERLRQVVAGTHLREGNFPQAAKIYQEMATKSELPGIAPFYLDRLGVSRWREGSLDAAQASFQLLERETDPFWQRLGKVRLADLELARLTNATTP